MATTPLSRLIKALRLGLLALAVLVAIPVVLTPLYLFIDPISVPMLERYLTGRPVDRQWRDMTEISDRLKAAVVMSEDGQFCRHWGVDLSALRTEIDNRLHGRPARGASTISMQVARNLFLGNAHADLRKALEIPLALYLDLILPKRRILEIYLNIAEWGPSGQFGIAAGTQAAFRADPATMNWSRAALMATALPNPILRHPGRPTGHLASLASIIARRAQQYGDRAACVSDTGKLAL